MRKLYLLCLVLLTSIFSNAQTVTIGTGTTSTLSTSTAATSLQSPYNSYYGYSWVQTIYLQSEISASGNITSIKYNFSGTSLTNSDQVKIYMGHVSRSSFASTTDWEPLSNLTLVFDGVITGTVPGWVTINLTTPFAYNNTSNLVIAVDENKAGDNGQPGYFASNLGTNRVIFYRSDGTNPDPATPLTAQGRSSYVGNIQIDGLTLGCQLPTAISSSAITTNSATILWTAPASGPSPAGYEYELRTSGAPGSGATGLVTASSTSATSASLSSLSPGTNYSFYIRTNCGGGNLSGWSAATNFVTQCVAINVPYNENFNGVTAPAIPTCHLVENTNADVTTWRTIAGISGLPAVSSNAIGYQYNSVSTTTGANDWFFTRQLNLTAGTSYTLRFKYLASSPPTYTEKLKVQIGTAQSSSAMSGAIIFDNSNVNSNAYTDANVTFTVPSTGIYVLGFHAYSNPDQDWLIVDDLNIDVTPTCAEPTIQTATSITTSGATLNWTAPSVAPATYEVYYSTLNTPPTAVTVPSQTGIVGTSQSISGLSANTTYYAWVRSNCGGLGVSPWTSSASTFTTPCTDITILPHTQGFNAAPACWTVATVSGTANWTLGASSTDIAAPKTGAAFVYKPYTTSSANLYSAPFNLAALGSTPGRINFWFYRHSSTVAADEAKFYINTSASATGATQLIALKPLTTEAPAVPSSGWYNYTAAIPLSFNTAGTVYFIVQATTTAGFSSYDIGLDEFTVEAAPSCIAPTTLVANATLTTAAISWTASASTPSAGYQWEVRTSGAAGSGATGLVAGGSTAAGIISDNVTGLLGSASYTLYVRANCGGGDFSSWASTTFTTSLVNDEATGALPLVMGAGCTGASYTNIGATKSANEVYPSCSGIAQSPVWFKFVATSSAVRITTDAGTGNTFTDSKVGLFSAVDANDYSTFNIISCDDDGGSVLGSGFMSVVYATGLTPGNTYYIAVDRYSGSTTLGSFCITVDDLTTSMLSTTNTCASTFQTPSSNSNTTYKGWFPLVDGSSKLIALARNPAGTDVSTYTVAQNVNTGAIRQSGGIYYLDRNYRINNTTATNVDVQFFFLNTELASLSAVNTATLGTLAVVRQTGTTCQNNFASTNGTSSLLPQTANGSVGGVSWIQVTTPSFSNFYIQRSPSAGQQGILPANLLTFSGVRSGGANQLKWTIAQETDVQVYQVERSEDGRTWAKAGSVNSLGNTASQRSYSFNDNNLSGVKQFYRLRQVDRNGSEKLSNTIMITGSKATLLAVNGLFPNPALDKVNLLVDAPAKDNVTIMVMDAVGRVVKTQKGNVEAGSNTLQLNVTGLAQGSYVIKLKGESSTQTTTSKFVKE